MTEFVNHLTQLIVRDNAVLFVGAELRHEAETSLAIQHIAAELAVRIQSQRSDLSLPTIARDFEVLKGRNELIMALREILAEIDPKPDPTYQLIADAVLPMTKVVTTRFDQILERALDQFDKPYVVIVRDTDVPFFDESKITLIKMQGDISQPDSLVITEDDIDAFISRLPTVSDVIRAFFATKTLIFLGYDLNSEQFKRLYRQVTRNLSNFRRKAYAIVSQAVDEVETQYWQGQNVEISLQEPLAFLEALAQAVKAAVREPRPNPNPLARIAKPALPDRPYKALDSFTALDAPIFTGRNEESQRLTNRILAHRLTILYGESGSGKSSLLQAGAGPLLAKNRALLAVCIPAPDQPLLDLLYRSLVEAGQGVGLPPAGDTGLLSLLREWQRVLDGPLVLSIDQFEQFFLLYTPQERQATTGILNELLNDRSLDLRLVLVVREDFLGRLQTLEEQLPGILDMRFRLDRLGREEARAAIEKPTRLFNITWEAALVQGLLDDLAEGSSGDVMPPQLQIVCDYLYRELVERRNSALSSSGSQITLAQFEALGGTQTILGDYLNRVVQSFPAAQQLTVQVLLGALVSSSGVKYRLPLDDLARVANIKPAEAEPLLDELTHQRLLQRFERPLSPSSDPRPSYELTHDYLVTRIADWLGETFWAAQKVREIVRQALPEWENRGRLLALDDLRLITLQRDNVHFTPAELELIYATAIGYDNDPASWQVHLPGETCRHILLQLLDNPEGFVRRQTALRLAEFPQAEVATALANTALNDSDPSVRESATQAVVQLIAVDEVAGREAIRPLVEATTNPMHSDAACQALVVIRDHQPAAEALLPTNLRRPILRRVWRIRWQRGWQQILAMTLRGFQGGFWGLGLGFGLFLGLNVVIEGGFALKILLQNVVTLVGILAAGIPFAGLAGALSGGSSAFVRAVLSQVQDRQHPWRVWMVATGTGMVMMGLSFAVLAIIFQGEPLLLRSMIAGLLLGLGLIGSASLPLKQPARLRLGLTIVINIGIFFLTDWLNLINNTVFWWLIVMGAAAGFGFFWGLNPLDDNARH